jgi:hypothetical protein
MYVATLDILTEKGGFDPRAARAIGEAIDLEIARSREASATREDVGECRRALGEEIGLLRGDTDRSFSGLRSEMGTLRSELKENISTLRAELKGDISSLRTELKEDISALRAQIKVEMHTMKADLVRWVFVVIMGQTAMLLGVLYFFMKFVK